MPLKKRPFRERWKSAKRGFVAGAVIGSLAWAGVHAKTSQGKAVPKPERPAIKAPAANNVAQKPAAQAFWLERSVQLPGMRGEPNLPARIVRGEPNSPAVAEPNQALPKKLVAEKFPADSGKISVLLPKSTPCISAKFIDAELKARGSPAAGKGNAFFKFGRQYGIRPEVALGFFRMESNFGKEGLAAKTKAIGNVRYTPPKEGSGIKYTNYNGFRCYASWEDGIKDFYRLLAGKIYAGGGRKTLEEIIPKYAPPTENSPQRYQEVVSNYIRQASKEAETKGLISLFSRFITRKW